MRSTLRNEFLKKCFSGSYNVIPLKHDASKRRYFRLIKNNQNFILMDAPPEFESVLDFINVTNFLASHDFSVPEIYHKDIINGFLILEDFGNNIVNNYLDKHSEEESKIYFLAIDNLVKLTHIIPPANLPKHDKEILLSGVTQFQEFYLESSNQELISACSEIFDQLNYKHNHVCLRDYHADNLVYLDDRKTHKQIGLLDYQDACSGFVSYDLLSLLQDARKYISPQLQEKYLQYFLDKMPNLNQEEFLKEYEILAFQRNARIIGLFNKLNKQDKNPLYLPYLDNVSKYFTQNLKSSHLTELSLILTSKI